MKKKILSFLLAVVMIVGMLPLGAITAFAEEPAEEIPEELPEEEPLPEEALEEPDGQILAVEGPVPYLAYENGEFVTRYCEEYKYYTTWDVSSFNFGSRWYVLDSGVAEFPSKIIGDVSIILLNGADCYFESNIVLAPGSTLKIYAQPEEPGKSVGKLRTGGGGGASGAGIGGSYFRYDDDSLSCGDLYIYGGKLELQGGEGAAGIGGSNVNKYSGDGGNVYIYGGDVTAIGGNYAPGIGGGACEESCGAAGNLYVYGGKLNAYGSKFAAGIGGGASEDAGGDGGNVYIFGGTVEAHGGEGAAGIGGGTKTEENTFSSDAGEGGNGGYVEINGGTVKAYGGSATGSRDSGGGAGIGGGQWGEGIKTDINGGTVYAYGGYGAAGIGGGTLCDGAMVNISCEKAETYVYAQGGDYGAGIGGGNEGDGNPVTVDGGTVDALGGWYAAGIGGGNEGNGFMFWLNGGYVCAEGNWNAAGIGGGNKGNGGEVFLNAGELMVSAGTSAYAIGAGDSNNTEGSVEVGKNNYVYDLRNYQHTLVNPNLIDKDWNNYFLYKDFVHVEVVPADVQKTDYLEYMEITKKFMPTTINNALPIVNKTVLTTWIDRWYVVDRNQTVDDVITVSGKANLILKNGCTLNAAKGINVRPGGSLTVYAQSQDETEMGRLIAQGAENSAGIGGGEEEDCGIITINGGYIEATGGKRGAGIGGGYGGQGGLVTVNGGKVKATGGERGAGIGSGSSDRGGNFIINGGDVEATGGSEGAGIGGGYWGFGGSATFAGGKVVAKGGYGAAGIGGGNKNNGANIVISGSCTVKAEAGEDAPRAIGNGIKSDSLTSPGTISVDENIIVTDNKTGARRTSTKSYTTDWLAFLSGTSVDFTATFGKKTSYYVMNGNKSDDLNCTVMTDDVIVWSDSWYVVSGECAIPSVKVSGNVNLILEDGCKLTVGGINVPSGSSLAIYGQSQEKNEMGKLIAQGAENHAGIGGIDANTSGAIIINGGYVKATGGLLAAGIGGGKDGEGASVTVNGGYVQATGGDCGAGIGGGDEGNGGTFTINGGEVVATGGIHGAGIGGGYGGTGGNVTLAGGKVTARSVFNAAGIGGGNSDGGAKIKITGICTVTAEIGEDSPRAIGGGKYSSDPGTFDVAKGLFLKNENGELLHTNKDKPLWTDVLKGRKVTFSSTKLSYLAFNEETGSFESVEMGDSVILEQGMTEWTNGTYFATGNVTLSDVTVNGDVKLILANGCTLDVTDVIEVPEGSSLTVYACSENYDEAGTLIVNESGNSSREGDAGIGGGGNVTFHGGNVISNGTAQGAGIGGSYESVDYKTVEYKGVVTIYGGRITATGGKQAAGIGGGAMGKGTVKIYGGKITAKGGNNGGAGIGGGYTGSCDVLINGGDIIAIGGDGSKSFFSTYKASTGIGRSGNGNAGIVTISGDNIHAIGGKGVKSSNIPDADAIMADEIILNPKELHALMLTAGSDTVEYPEKATVTLSGKSDIQLESVLKKNILPGEDDDTPTNPDNPSNPTNPSKPANPTNPTSPQTGDTSNMSLWVMLLVLSSMGICVCLVLGKKKKTVK